MVQSFRNYNIDIITTPRETLDYVPYYHNSEFEGWDLELWNFRPKVKTFLHQNLGHKIILTDKCTANTDLHSFSSNRFSIIRSIYRFFTLSNCEYKIQKFNQLSLFSETPHSNSSRVCFNATQSSQTEQINVKSYLHLPFIESRTFVCKY